MTADEGSGWRVDQTMDFQTSFSLIHFLAYVTLERSYLTMKAVVSDQVRLFGESTIQK